MHYKGHGMDNISILNCMTHYCGDREEFEKDLKKLVNDITFKWISPYYVELRSKNNLKEIDNKINYDSNSKFHGDYPCVLYHRID